MHRRSKVHPPTWLALAGKLKDTSYTLAGIVVVSAGLSGVGNSLAANVPVCATSEQRAAIGDAYSRMPGALPYEVAKNLKMSEAGVVAGLSDRQSVGTRDGQAFAKIWESVIAWERPAVLIRLDDDNVVEVSGRIGPHVISKNGQVRVDVQTAGVGGHFRPDSISSIYVVSLPRADGKVLHGVLFFGSSDKSLFGIYALESAKPAVLGLLGTDAYQKTWDIVNALPRSCAK